MAKRRKSTGNHGAARPARTMSVGIRRTSGVEHELTPPACARARQDDLEEVHAMLQAGEHDVARDELRWLLEGCTDFLDAHVLLGEIALAEGDAALARGHFGYAFRLGQAALKQAGRGALLPHRLPGNQAFFAAAQGLAAALLQQGETALAQQIIAQATACDPAVPLSLSDLQNPPAPQPPLMQIELSFPGKKPPLGKPGPGD